MYCDFHRFRFDDPPSLLVTFPHPLGPVGEGGEAAPADVGLWCNDAPGDGSYSKVDLRSAVTKFDPSWLAVGGIYDSPPAQSSQLVAQTWQDSYVCAPIDADESALPWQLLADRAASAMHSECMDWLVDAYGCVQGSQYPALGQGAWDVCLWYLVNHLELSLASSTYQVRVDGQGERLIYTAATLCDTAPLDQSCGS